MATSKKKEPAEKPQGDTPTPVWPTLPPKCARTQVPICPPNTKPPDCPDGFTRPPGCPVITEPPICPSEMPQTATLLIPATLCPPCPPITHPPMCPGGSEGAQTLFPTQPPECLLTVLPHCPPKDGEKEPVFTEPPYCPPHMLTSPQPCSGIQTACCGTAQPQAGLSPLTVPPLCPDITTHPPACPDLTTKPPGCHQPTATAQHTYVTCPALVTAPPQCSGIYTACCGTAQAQIPGTAATLCTQPVMCPITVTTTVQPTNVGCPPTAQHPCSGIYTACCGPAQAQANLTTVPPICPDVLTLSPGGCQTTTVPPCCQMPTLACGIAVTTTVQPTHVTCPPLVSAPPHCSGIQTACCGGAQAQANFLTTLPPFCVPANAQAQAITVGLHCTTMCPTNVSPPCGAQAAADTAGGCIQPTITAHQPCSGIQTACCPAGQSMVNNVFPTMCTQPVAICPITVTTTVQPTNVGCPPTAQHPCSGIHTACCGTAQAQAITIGLACTTLCPTNVSPPCGAQAQVAGTAATICTQTGCPQPTLTGQPCSGIQTGCCPIGTVATVCTQVGCPQPTLTAQLRCSGIHTACCGGAQTQTVAVTAVNCPQPTLTAQLRCSGIHTACCGGAQTQTVAVTAVNCPQPTLTAQLRCSGIHTACCGGAQAQTAVATAFGCPQPTLTGHPCSGIQTGCCPVGTAATVCTQFGCPQPTITGQVPCSGIQTACCGGAQAQVATLVTCTQICPTMTPPCGVQITLVTINGCVHPTLTVLNQCG